MSLYACCTRAGEQIPLPVVHFITYVRRVVMWSKNVTEVLVACVGQSEPTDKRKMHAYRPWQEKVISHASDNPSHRYIIFPPPFNKLPCPNKTEPLRSDTKENHFNMLFLDTCFTQRGYEFSHRQTLLQLLRLTTSMHPWQLDARWPFMVLSWML